MVRILVLTALMALGACRGVIATESSQLPVWLEESHAGSFYFFADTLPLHEPHTLVLIDAHSDASAIAGSDAIRQSIRKVASREERQAKLAQWRETGRLQCFDWIEPLMPLPFSEVIWIPAKRLEEEKRVKMEREAREQLDAHEEGLPRESGPLGSKFRVMDLEHWIAEMRTWPQDRRVAVSVDLDWFATLRDESLESEMEAVTDAVLELRGLRALSWSLSTPWLRSLEQADKLLCLALDESWRLANASVRWEPFAVTGPDRSLLAKLMQRQGRRLPVFDLTAASPLLRSTVLRHWTAANTQVDVARLEKLMEAWRGDAFLPLIAVPDRARESDGSYAFEWGQPGKIVLTPPPTGATVRWWALRPAQDVYRVMEADLGLASNAPAWIQLKKVLLAEGPALGSLELTALAPVLDAKFHSGTTRIVAEVIHDGESRITHELTVKVSAAGTRGLRAAWSRQFALPYIFGSTALHDEFRTGPDAGWGADCANFISAGLRHAGWLIPWGNPRDLRAWLTPWKGQVDAEEGCVLHFGTHVAALWEDRAPLGELGDDDLVVHQLEGRPEVLPFGKLREGRQVAQVLGVREPAKSIQLVFGGDVMLGRRVGAGIVAGRDPLAGIAEILKAADLAVVNLECPLLPEGMERDAKAPFAAPAVGVALLGAAGVDAVTLANNHALDRGSEGVADTLAVLEKKRISAVGAGRAPEDALSPVVLQAGARRFALISVFDDEASTKSGRSHVVATQSNPSLVVQAIEKAKGLADVVIVLPHWGREHDGMPTDAQRKLAEDWLEAGASFVIGSGPHVVQPLEHLLHGSVAWSLGNLVFDGPGPAPEWSRGALLELTLDAETLRLSRARLIPVEIADDGAAALAR